jgi:hypothetical protein
VVVAAAARLGHLAFIKGTPLYHFSERWVSSDMYANVIWADRLAGGDWLDRETFRPRFGWQDRVASPEVWQRWLGHGTYYQPPLYSYLLAFVIRATGSPDLFRVLQAILGAVNVGMLGWLGWRMISPLVGVTSASLAALYAPWILYDGELLRGTLAITLGLLALLALHAARTGPRPDGKGWRHRGRWLLAGAALGLAYLGDSSIVTFIPLAFLWILIGSDGGEEAGRKGGRGDGLLSRVRGGLPSVGMVAAGILAALVPLMIRNLVVGAPLLSVTTRAPLAFIMGNAPETTPVGASIPPSTAAILNASEYRLLPTIVETLKAHQGRIGDILNIQWQKLSAVFNSYEVPDNPSFYYAALHSPVLRYGMRFSCVVGLALAGLWLGARRFERYGLLYLHLASILGLFIVAQVVSRYRQPILISLFLFAGVAVTELVGAIRAGRFSRAGVILAGAVVLSFVMPATPPPGYRYYRSAEFLAAAGFLEGRGEIKDAGKEIQRGIAMSLQEDSPAEERIRLGLELTSLYVRHREYPQALSALRGILYEDPDHAVALATKGAIHQDINQPWQALQVLTRAAQADPDNPEVHGRLGHLYWFVYESSEKALGHLERALEIDPSSPAAPLIRELVERIRASMADTP